VSRSHSPGFLDAVLRSGNVYTSRDVLAFIEPHLAWFGERICRGWLRMDAGFPSEDFLAGIEAHEKWRYVARLKMNSVLEAMALPYVNERSETKGPNWQPQTYSVELGPYQASRSKVPWSRARRVVLILEEQIDATMPRWFFLVTHASVKEASASMDSKRRPLRAVLCVCWIADSTVPLRLGHVRGMDPPRPRSAPGGWRTAGSVRVHRGRA
jgi:hypothetical protein